MVQLTRSFRKLSKNFLYGWKCIWRPTRTPIHVRLNSAILKKYEHLITVKCTSFSENALHAQLPLSFPHKRNTANHDMRKLPLFKQLASSFHLLSKLLFKIGNFVITPFAFGRFGISLRASNNLSGL